MFTSLRIIRGFFGFLFALQILTALPAISWVSNPSAITPEMLGTLFAKLILAAIFGAVFLGFRALINRLYLKKYGEPHPALAESKWKL